LPQIKPEEFFQERHPDYDKYSELWNGMRVAYYGGNDFMNKYLFPYEGEEDEDLQKRRQQAAYENQFQDIIERREAIVFSRNISRDVLKANAAVGQWQLIKMNVDNRGNEWHKFIKKCFRMAQTYGFLPVLTDRPQGSESTTRAQEEANGLLPYALPILPTAFINWEIDEGRLKWCVIRSVNRMRSPMEPIKEVTEYRLITDEVIQIWEQNGENGEDSGKVKFISEITHNVGRVPVVILNDIDPKEDSLVGLPSLHNAVDLSIQLYNMQSWQQNLLYTTNFSQLALTPYGGEGEDTAKRVGPKYALWVPPGGTTPTWVAPPMAPAEVFEKRTKDARRRIYEIAKLDAGLSDDTARELSGEAYDRRHKPTEDEARREGKRMEDFEKELADLLINGWLKHDAEIQITYPKRYGVRATAEALGQLEAVEKSETLPQSVKSKLAAQIIFTEDFAEMSDEEQDALYEEIVNYDPLAIELDYQRKLEEAKAAPTKDIEAQKQKKEVEKAKIDADARIESERVRADAEVKKAEAEANKPQQSTGLLA
jgi:hypothetical protein